MKDNLKVTYYIDNDLMSDKEFDEQGESEFIITKEMIYDLILKKDTKIEPLGTIEILDMNLINK